MKTKSATEQQKARTEFKTKQLIQSSFDAIIMAKNDLDEAVAWNKDLKDSEEVQIALETMWQTIEQLKALGAKEEV